MSAIALTMTRANPDSIVCRRSSRQEVLWFANGNFKKVIHIENGWERAGFGAKRLVMVQLACACQGRVAPSSLDLHLDSARRA
jgi:hypothetical protein